jgi:beta-RFAP synthase
MIRVRTPSRLHFGLLNVGPADPPARQFGGVGLMVQAPGIQLTAAAAPEWSAEGPLAGRALAFARSFTETLDSGAVRPQHLRIEAAALDHVGLGTGTQLGLAVARALALAHGLAQQDAVALARRVRRGGRSALGVHGFEYGGFLVDGGRGAREDPAPLVARLPFPDEWRLLLALPPCGTGLHGTPEQQAFARLSASLASPERTAALCRLVLLGLLPALAERDLEAFGEALYDFNVRVGEAFAAVQGGTYAGPAVADLVAFVRGLGVRGVGQSSWGPAVFAVTADEERARHLAGRIRQRFTLEPGQVLLTAACNNGACAEQD